MFKIHFSKRIDEEHRIMCYNFDGVPVLVFQIIKDDEWIGGKDPTKPSHVIYSIGKNRIITEGWYDGQGRRTREKEYG